MKPKSLVQQLYEVSAAQRQLDRQTVMLKRKLAKRLKPGETEVRGPFYVTITERPACDIPSHTRKACLVWDVGVK